MDNQYRIIPVAFKNHWVIEYRSWIPPENDIYGRREGRWTNWHPVEGASFSNPAEAEAYVQTIKRMLKKEIIYLEG